MSDITVVLGNFPTSGFGSSMANVTSRIVEASTNKSEAVLIVDDLASAPVIGTNLIQGVQLDPAQIRFSAVPIRAPGSGATTTLRIKNLKVNARDWTLPTLQVGISSFPWINLSVPIALQAVKSPGAIFTVQSAAGAAAQALNFAAGTGTALTHRLSFSEGFADAFRKRNAATSIATANAIADQNAAATNYQTESGFLDRSLPAAGGLNQAGLATQGSRLIARFESVPANTTIYVSTRPLPSTGSSSAVLIAANASGAGAYSETAQTTTVTVGGATVGLAPVTIVNGTGAATWEILDADPAAAEEYVFGVVVVASQPGTATVAGGLGPLGSVAVSDSVSPLPRFGSETLGAPACASCLTVAPSALALTYESGSTPSPITMRVLGAGISFSASVEIVSGPDGWISVSPTAGGVPGTFSVAINPVNLPSNDYHANILVTGGAQPVTVPVYLRVTPAASGYVPFGCTYLATGNPTQVRVGGIAELLGDVVLVCGGGTPAAAGAPVSKATIKVSLDTPLTSRTYANGWSEVLLLIDEPGSGLVPSSQLACADPSGICTITGTGNGVGVYSGAAGRPNVFPGKISGNTVTFQDVPLDPPGSGGVPFPPSGTVRALRIVNLRTDVSGLPFAMEGQTAIEVKVTAGTLPVAGAVQVGGFLFTSSTFSVRSSDNGTPISYSMVPTCASAGPQRVGVLRFVEGFAAAFKDRAEGAFVDANTSPAPQAQNMPAQILPGHESSFYAPSLTSAVADFSTVGLANFGTRLRARIDSIPAGARVYVSTQRVIFTNGVPSVGPNSLVARLVTSEAGVFAAAASTGTLDNIPVVELAVVSGSATAVWEVIRGNPNATDTFDFAYWVQPGSPSSTLATVTASPGPAQSGAFYPRFQATPPRSLFQVNSCTVDFTTPAALPGGTAWAQYNQVIQATGGFPLYSFFLDGGSLPSGVYLNSTGALSGIPQGVSGTFTFTVRVRDSNNNEATRTFSLTIASAPDPGPPSVGSVSPSSGTGYTAWLTFNFSNPGGVEDFSELGMWLAPSASGSAVNSCKISAVPTWGLVPSWSIGLLDDAGQNYIRRNTGSGLLQNSQCVVDLATITLPGGGTAQQIYLKVTFRAGYAGAINLYGKADSRRGVTTGWQQKGTWTVGGLVYARLTAPALPADGASAVFEADYIAADDANQDINDLNAVVFWMTKGPTTSTFASSCWISYTLQTAQFHLAADDGSNLIPLTPNSGFQQNSQCAIDTSQMSVTFAGNSAIGLPTMVRLKLPLTFKSGFNGPSNVYLLANRRSAGGFFELQGSFVAGAKSIIYSPTPNSYLGGTQVTIAWTSSVGAGGYRLTIGDTPGSANWTDLTTSETSVNVAGLPSDGRTLYARLYTSFGGAWVYNDYSYTALAPPLRVGAITPSAATGTAQVFNVGISDTSGGGHVRDVILFITPDKNVSQNTCIVTYQRDFNHFVLSADDGQTLPPVTLGSSATVENSQCVFDGAQSGVSIVGNDLNVTFGLRFKTAFAGRKFLYVTAACADMQAEYKEVGTYTVASLPALSILSAHAGKFTRGQSGAVYTLTIGNGPSAAPTNGLVTVTESLPTGLTLVGMSGAGWACLGASCTRSDSLPTASIYPPIAVTVNVASDAPALVINQVALSGGGSPNANASDPTTVVESVIGLIVLSNPGLGAVVTLTATVPAGASGKVAFYDGATFLGTAPVSGGQAVFTTRQLRSGRRSLRAYYPGAGVVGGGLSPVVTATVTATAADTLGSPVKYPAAASPGNVVIADFTGDGKPDIADPQGYAGGVSLLPGTGTGTFGTATLLRGGGPTHIVTADFDGDGTLDIAGVSPGSNEITILLRQGTGFKPATSFSIAYGQAPNFIAAADFNLDGKADLAVTYYAGDTLVVFAGNGDGTFRLAGQTTVGSWPTIMAPGDFNGDGWADLAVLRGSSVYIFPGKGDFTFQAAVPVAFTGVAPRILVEDFDADGKADLAVSTQQQFDGVQIRLGNGDLTFGAAQQVALNAGTVGLAAGDFNGDGKLDIAAAKGNSGGLAILYGNGDGSFLAPVHYSGFNAYDLAAGDLNGDGREDVAATHFAVNEAAVTVLLGARWPSLQAALNPVGIFYKGQSASYRIRVGNTASSDPTTGAVTVVHTLPSGFTHTSTSGDGWSCSGNTCSRSDALNGGASYPDITVTFNIAADINTPQITSVLATGGGSENVTAEHAAMIALPPAVLSVSKSHTGSFNQGQLGAAYTIVVQNAASAGPTSGTVQVSESLPAGLTLVSMSGDGWTCSNGSCSRSDILVKGASWQPITVLVNVAAGATSPQVNSVTVSGGGSTSAVASDSTTIAAVCPSSLSPTGVAADFAGGPGSFSVNAAAGCNWTAVTNAPWLTVLSNPSGSGSGSVNYAIAPNMGSVPRSGTITVGGQTFTVTQIGVAARLGFVPVTPCRIIDTRNAVGPLGGPYIAAGTTRTLPVTSSTCGVLATAKAYSLNITVVPKKGTLGYLTVWPTGQAQPLASTLNSGDGSVLANAAIVPAGTGGSINAYATNDTELIIDINGYFAPAGIGTLQFYPVTPCRVLDTRDPIGTFGGPAIAANTSRSFAVGASGCGMPSGASAYSINVTAVPRGALQYVTAWPTGQPQPMVSILNSLDGTILANAAIVPAGANGGVSFFSTNTTDLIVDINGYFAPPSATGLNFYALAPCRVVDTRSATGALGGPFLPSGGARTFPFPQGPCGLPLDASAYSINVTVVPSGGLQYLTTWPAGGQQPIVSTLNALKGQIVANAAFVPAGADGAVKVYVTNSSHVVIDVNGYFGK